MSIDHSLKIKGALERHRNVLTRAERVGQLKDEERWSEGQSVFGLPKIAHRKSHAGKKAKEEAAVEGAVAAPEAQAGAIPTAAGPTPTKAATGAAPAKEKAAEKPKEKERGKGKS